MRVSLFSLLFLFFTTCYTVSPEEPYHIRVGNVDIWKVQDSSVLPPYAFFFPTLQPSNWSRLVDINGKPYIDDKGNFVTFVSFSGTLIHSENTWILVDDGVGVVDPIVPSNQTNRIPALVTLAGAAPTNLNYILFSHFHTDHTGWNVFLDKMNQLSLEFPNAIYIAQQDEIDYWTSSAPLINASHYNEVLYPVVQAKKLVGVNGVHSITTEVTLLPCKGHTPGHQCVAIESNGQSALIIGDTMHHPVQVQMPQWSATFDWNTTFSVPTRKAIINKITSENSVLIAPHFPFPGIGKLVKDPAGSVGRSGWIYVPVEE